jgi:hypothetical protein
MKTMASSNGKTNQKNKSDTDNLIFLLNISKL